MTELPEQDIEAMKRFVENIWITKKMQ